MIENLVIDSDKLRFLSSSTVYEYKNGSILVATSPRMTPISNHNTVKYNCFRQHVEKESVIWKIDSENHKAYIFTKVLQGELFVSISKLICSW